jgi:hypothetical protein
VKHRALQRARDNARHKEYNREWRAKSFKLEIKRDPRQGQRLIFCSGCHQWVWSYFEPYCAECREVKRQEINTDWIYQAETRFKEVIA